MSTLEQAIKTALRGHAGQKEKNGGPYILHPLRVMLGCDSEEKKIAAVLHDVVEDTELTLDQLAELGFAKEIITAVDALTRRNEESYDDFIKRAAFDPIARPVKLRDIEDNLNILRIDEPTDKDLGRLKRYRKAHAYLRHIAEITKGVTIGEFREGPKGCGQLCTRMELIPAGVPYGGTILRGGAGVLHFSGWSDYTERIDANQYERVREALLQQDSKGLYTINPWWSPFYCPECGENYHKGRWLTVYIDDNYTVLQGKCPKGHERILEN